MRMRITCWLWWKAFFTFLAVVVFVVNTSAGGPVILGGDDLTDHGSRSGTTLFDGWLYIQKALENLAPAVTRPGNDGSVAVLGSLRNTTATSSNAGAVYNFAVPNAGATTSLSGIVTFHDGATAINQFFTDLAAGNVKPAIIVTAGTNAQNDLELDEGTALTDNALAIANFVNSGGGLLSHGFEPFTGNIAYGWLTDLIPGASVFTGCDVDTLSLTLLGQLAFPGLTNSDIRSGPCHNHFVDHGLPVLARDAEGATADPGPPSGSSVAEPEPDDNGSSATADSFFIGDDYTGTITPETTPITGFDLDYVSFSGTAGQAIVATTVLGTLVDSALTLFDTDGVTSLAFNDDFGGSLASQIIFTLPSTGTFFLRMRNFSSDDSGTYTLQLRQNLSTNLGRNIIIGGGNISLPGQIALTPEVVFNPLGTDHTVTANVVDLAGNPLENILVTFEVLSGPNSGTMGTNTTVANGDASFTYTSNGEVELDVIQASFVDDVTGNTVLITARKYWDLDCQPNSIPDTCDLSCDAFNRACAADFPGCGRSVDTDNSDDVPDECINDAPQVALGSFQCLEARKTYTPRRYRYKRFGGITHLKLRSHGLHPENFCSPVDVFPVGEEGQGIGDPPNPHLTCYEKKHWKYSKHFWRWWKHKKSNGDKRHRPRSDKQEITINNLFGDHTLRVSTKPDSLCLPSGKGDEPTPEPEALDRFKCFEAKKARGTRLENRKVTIDDGTESTNVKVVKPVAFCAPVDGDDMAIVDATDFLACYKVRVKRSHKHRYGKWGHWKHRVSSEKITVNNDLKVGQKLKVSELETICVPSTILMSETVLRTTDDDDDDDDDDDHKKKKKKKKDDDDDD